MTNVNPITVDRIHIRIPAGIDATTILDLCSMAGCLVSRTLVGAHITGDLDQLRHTLSILPISTVLPTHSPKIMTLLTRPPWRGVLQLLCLAVS